MCLHVLCCTSLNASYIWTPYFGYNNIICTHAEWGFISAPPLLPSSLLFPLQHNQIPSRLLALHIGRSVMYLPDLGVIVDHTLFLSLLWAFVCSSTRRAYLVGLWKRISLALRNICSGVHSDFPRGCNGIMLLSWYHALTHPLLLGWPAI